MALRVVGGLARAAHPGPALAVVALATAWAVAVAGAGAGTALLVAAAVLAGQLTIGWCNDWVDAAQDAAAARAGKPVVAGLVTRRAVGAAAVAAGASCLVLSLALGAAAGVVHLVAVGAGLAYDLRLKATVWSPVPYAVAFGLLPVVVTLAVDGTTPPPALVGAAALLGVAAHLANAVPDAETDRLVGVRGLPQRLGPTASLVGAALAVLAAAAVLVLGGELGGPGGPGDAQERGSVLGPALLVLGVLGAAAVPAVVVGGVLRRGRAGAPRPPGRGVFWAVVASAVAVLLATVLG